jgi:predicted dehydrogenase
MLHHVHESRSRVSDVLRVGLLGLGPRGRNGWVRSLALCERIRLAAVCDRHPASLEQGARAAGLRDRDAHARLEDMLARSDLDAIVISVAPELQPDLAVAALEAGKHVLCEVPLCYSLVDCWRIVLAAESTGSVLAMAEQMCHAPFARAWRRLVARGELGEILLAEAEYLHGMPDDWYWIDGETGDPLAWADAASNPRAQKTRLWTLHHPAWYNPHSLSPLLHVLDDRVASVTCMSTKPPSRVRPELPVADVEVALATTDRGTIIRISTGFVASTPNPWHWYRVMGSLGDLQTSRSSSSGIPDSTGLAWSIGSGSPDRVETVWSPEDAAIAAVAAGAPHGGLDYYAVADFADAIIERRSPTVDVYRAAQIAAVGVLAGASAEAGATPMPVPDFRPSAARPSGAAPG